MLVHTMRRVKNGGFLALMVALSAIPAVADTANFAQLTLSPGFPSSSGVVSGHTGGTRSLPDIVAKSDRRKLDCLGFGDPTPDHIMVLQKDFSRLKLQVNSGGKDTTLLVQGPDNSTIRCGDDSDANPDASLEDSKWDKGTYRIWVGSMEAGVRLDYTLSAQE